MRILLLSLFAVLLLSACRIFSFGLFYLSENHQKPSSPKNIIASNDQPGFQFKEGNPETAEFIGNLSHRLIKAEKRPGEKISLSEYLGQHTQTTAFLVIRHDTILFEEYYDGFSENSLLPSFSVAKSFTSALVGIALEEGHLDAVTDPVIKYLPELRDKHPYWGKMTIEHLLNMRSGIKFNEDSYVNPYSGVADLYMTKNVMRVISKAKFDHEPGRSQYYSSLDTEILGVILERATGSGLSEYMQEKIWIPCQMESEATWDLDSKKHQHTKSFCCLRATARDYARFGRLYMNKGKWQGKEIVPEAWVNQSILPNFKNNCYQYQWYSVRRGYKSIKNEEGKYTSLRYPDSLAAAAAIEQTDYELAVRSRKDSSEWLIKRCGPGFYALGIFGQEVYINPEEEMIFVRLGQKWDTSNRALFRIIEYNLEKSGL